MGDVLAPIFERMTMADNHTYFSEIIEDITPEQAKWIETVLGIDFDGPPFGSRAEAVATLADLLGKKVEELKDFDPNWWPGFAWSTKGADKGTLWIYCEEGYREECLVLFVQSFIRKFRPDMVFTISGACTCSKMRLNEFGGMWLVITKDQILGGSTWDEIEKTLKKLGAMAPLPVVFEPDEGYSVIGDPSKELIMIGPGKTAPHTVDIIAVRPGGEGTSIAIPCSCIKKLITKLQKYRG